MNYQCTVEVNQDVDKSSPISCAWKYRVALSYLEGLFIVLHYATLF